MLEELKQEVCQANKDLVEHGLVTLTWGNVSGISEDRKLVVIKPSGVDYRDLTPEKMVVVDLNGAVIEGDLRPSSDTPTHVCLYQNFKSIGGVTHTHSRYATSFSQARVELPCLGTTHADHFYGTVPVTRVLNKSETQTAYELNTGKVIVERFAKLDPVAMPAVLVAGHAPFTWGATAKKSLENAIALEAVAEMAILTRMTSGAWCGLEDWTLQKHYQRKHGVDAYYGQK